MDYGIMVLHDLDHINHVYIVCLPVCLSVYLSELRFRKSDQLKCASQCCQSSYPESINLQSVMKIDP